MWRSRAFIGISPRVETPKKINQRWNLHIRILSADAPAHSRAARIRDRNKVKPCTRACRASFGAYRQARGERAEAGAHEAQTAEVQRSYSSGRRTTISPARCQRCSDLAARARRQRPP